MEEIWNRLLSGIAGSGPVALMMLYAIKWLQASNRELLAELNKERDERISLLEGHISECDVDRKELRRQIVDLLLRPQNH